MKIPLLVKSIIPLFILTTIPFGHLLGNQTVLKEKTVHSVSSKPKVDRGIRAKHVEGKTDKKITHLIDKLHHQGITRSSDVKNRRLSRHSTKFIRISDSGKIQVTLQVTNTTREAVGELIGLGFQVDRVMSKHNRIQGWARFDRLEDLEDLDFVERIQTPSYAVPRQGSVMTEGDAILRGDVVRSAGFTGAGVRIGVVSDGVYGMLDSVAANELPSGTDVSCHPWGIVNSSVHCETFSTEGILAGAEGTAILEIIHDIAPDAELYFANVDTADDFIAAIEYLAAPESIGGGGVDILVDDLGFLLEPYFEDGDIAIAAQAVVDSDILYVSSAGNDGQTHIQEFFTDANADLLHEFQTGEQAYGFLVPPYADFIAVLQWDDAFNGPTNDMDLYLDLYDTEGFYVDSLSSTLPLGFSALEYVSFVNTTGVTLVGYVFIEKFLSDGTDVEFELFTSGGTNNQYFDEADSIYGHPAAPGVIAVGAIDQADDGYDTIEPFSSQGPVTILGEERNKPDVASIDGVAVTGNGGFSTPFFGTSASAPHVAACLALLLEADNTLSAEQAKNILTSSSVDLGDAGYDLVFGHGRADCFQAVSQVADIEMPEDPPEFPDPPEPPDDGDTGDGDDDPAPEDTGDPENPGGGDNNSSGSGSSGGCSLTNTATGDASVFFWFLLASLLIVILRLGVNSLTWNKNY